MASNEELQKQLETLISLNRRQTDLLAFAQLGDEKVINFIYRGEHVSMYLPQGGHDFIQSYIVRQHAFYERRFFDRLLERNIVKPGGVVIDAGANIGNHAVFFGLFLGAKKLICFEPQTAVFETLERNLDLNKIKHKSHRAMLGAEKGRGSLVSFNPANHGSASFAPKDDGDTPMVSIDSAVSKTDRKAVSFMKIDVEGGQLAVLEGARETIAEAQMPIWCEVFKDEADETRAFMEDIGYEDTKMFWSHNYIFVPKG